VINIREVQLSDSENFLSLSKKLDIETKFMLCEPNENTMSVQDQSRKINDFLEKKNHKLLLAEDALGLVGFALAIGGTYARNSHKAQVVIGILQDYASRGIGTLLLEELEKWAREAGIHKLELMVMSHNEKAIGLYNKVGFSEEGVKVHSLLVDGKYVDEIIMFKIID